MSERRPSYLQPVPDAAATPPPAPSGEPTVVGVDPGAGDDETVITVTGPAVCARCRHQWQAIVPTGTDLLECPACGTFFGRLRHAVEYPDAEVWACTHCDCTLWTIMPQGVHCAGCGRFSAPQDEIGHDLSAHRHLTPVPL